ncbi:MAG: hypothetical protein HUU20_26220 [Pirellulales bacterium]|nr:hypothetical protein [Pirellulales bacterium]
MSFSFTTVVACDVRHCDQLAMVWPTWRRCKPEIAASPLLLVCDARAGGEAWWRRRLDWLDHADRRIVLWDWPRGEGIGREAVTQRERMLTAFVHAPCKYVDTPYWLKIDTDTVATAAGPWYDPAWFAEAPALVASPWGYTRPGVWIDQLEAWADRHAQLGLFEPLGLRVASGAGAVRHRRLASWLCFVNTAWSRLAASYSPQRLPVPSQDTYHWYLAARRGDGIVRARMKNFGWASIHNDRRRQWLVEQGAAGQ